MNDPKPQPIETIAHAVKHVRAPEIGLFLTAKFKSGCHTAYKNNGKLTLWLNKAIDKDWPAPSIDQDGMLDILTRSGIITSSSRGRTAIACEWADWALELLGKETGKAPSKPRKAPVDPLAAQVKALADEVKRLSKENTNLKLSLDCTDREVKVLKAQTKKISKEITNGPQD